MTNVFHHYIFSYILAWLYSKMKKPGSIGLRLSKNGWWRARRYFSTIIGRHRVQTLTSFWESFEVWLEKNLERYDSPINNTKSTFFFFFFFCQAVYLWFLSFHAERYIQTSKCNWKTELFMMKIKLHLVLVCVFPQANVI